MAGFTYAVHTEVCTYLLDDGGICTGVLSPNVTATSKLSGCVGAQFVACVDTRVEGALIGELREGASALLVATSKETGRAQLMRTGPILRVQHCDTGESSAGLDVLEEIELEIDEEPSVQVKLPLDPKARRADNKNDPRKSPERSVIISDDATYPAVSQKPSKPAAARPAGKSRPSASELAGLAAPRKPSFTGATPDDTLRFSPGRRPKK